MAQAINMTSEEFDRILTEVLDEEPVCFLLTVPGVYEAVAEYFNNEVIKRWEQQNGLDED